MQPLQGDMMQREIKQMYNRAGEATLREETLTPGPYSKVEITTSPEGRPQLRLEVAGEEPERLLAETLRLYLAGMTALATEFGERSVWAKPGGGDDGTLP